MAATDTALALLQASLGAAVPLWIMQFKTQPPTRAELDAYAQEIAEHGDLILFRLKKPGGSAAAFNALAKAIAACAFAPGGVKVFGLHFEASR